jgi:glycosyltransferase involved in cell wall biosynthesis
MLLDHITPVILTRDEAPNIGRTLSQLGWAREIVVLDSGSSDATPTIARAFSNVRLIERTFDSHAAQWRFAINETGIATDWVLTLDADYIVPEPFVEELKRLAPADNVDVAIAEFKYAVLGHTLRASLYPARPVLMRRDRVEIYQDGHTQRVRWNGNSLALKSRIIHDDRKGLGAFLERQHRYMQQEADKLIAASSPGLTARIRRMRVVAPFAVAFHTLFVKRCILDGRAGLYYTFERVVAELILSMTLIGRDLQR